VQKSGEDPGAYRSILDSIDESFARMDIPEVVRLLDRRFGDRIYSLRSLFRDEQRRIVRTILSSTVAEAEAAYLQLYEHHAALMRYIASLGNPMPREFTAAMEYAVNSLLRRACSGEEFDGDRIKALLREARASNVSLDRTTLEFLIRRRIESLSAQLAADPGNTEKLQALRSALRTGSQMPFSINLWSAQNHVYAMRGSFAPKMRRKALRDSRAQHWLEEFHGLCEQLTIRAQ
jgi:hypothetical protein